LTRTQCSDDYLILVDCLPNPQCSIFEACLLWQSSVVSDPLSARISTSLRCPAILLRPNFETFSREVMRLVRICDPKLGLRIYSLDGFDITQIMNLMVHSYIQFYQIPTSLRILHTTDPSKTYYLPGAHQHPIPLNAIIQMDFVWVKFYNNHSCIVSSSGFISSVQVWSCEFNNGTKPIFLDAEAKFGVALGTSRLAGQYFGCEGAKLAESA